MLKKIFSFCAVLLVMFSFFAFKTAALTDKQNNFSISLEPDYTVLTADNLGENKDVLKKLNFTKSGFKNYLETNNIVLYAVDKSNGSEVSLKIFTSAFAENVGDMSLLDDNSVKYIAEQIVNDVKYSAEIWNGSKFIKAEYQSSDKGGEFSGSQYFTIKNGQIYALNISFPSGTEKGYVYTTQNNIMNNFKIETTSKFSWTNFGDIITSVIVFLAIALFTVVAGYIIYTFVTDIKNKNSSNDVAPYVKIKRRKF